jgi:hypothetical protein
MYLGSFDGNYIISRNDEIFTHKINIKEQKKIWEGKN